MKFRSTFPFTLSMVFCLVTMSAAMHLVAASSLPAMNRQPFEPEMIFIPAGKFLMGSSDSDPLASQDEKPQHTAYLPDYYIGKTEVTNAQYAAFIMATGRVTPLHWVDGKPPIGKENHPVGNVWFYDAVAYCDWLAEKTGKPYRLPTEAEWEKAARGTDGRLYPWGNRALTCEYAVMMDDQGFGCGKGFSPWPVGSKPQGASPYGLLDMAGNVEEWVSSVYKPYPYNPRDGREDPSAFSESTAMGGARVIRGGAFVDQAKDARCAARMRHGSNYHLNIGFRVACTVSEAK
jgi:formylglycine-generating enzyme required for sulfatase activity